MKVWTWKVASRYLTAVTSELAFVNRLLPETERLKPPQLESLLEELSRSAFLANTLKEHGHLSQDGTTELAAKLASTTRLPLIVLYVLPRVLRPTVVIETGCFTGWYSALLLSALYANQHGHLYTIDLPAEAGKFGLAWGLKEGTSPGFLVPPEMRYRWELTIGNSRVELPLLLQRVGEVDYFFHDSDHCYTHMTWEFSTVWQYLRIGGLLVSDDIEFNTAFWDFALGTRQPYAVGRGMGAVLKA